MRKVLLGLILCSSSLLGQSPYLDWAISHAGFDAQIAYAIDVDSEGNIYHTGYFRGLTDFDPSSATANLDDAGGNDIFVAKYDSSGNYLWAISLGGSNNDNGYALKIDDSDNVILTGSFQGTADFDPGPGQHLLQTAGSNDIFLAKYDSNGNLIWAHGMGASGNDAADALALDTAGNIVLSGKFENTVDFDPSSGFGLLSANGQSDAFLAKYDANGNYLWRKKIGGSGSDGGYSLAVDPFNDILLTGYFSTTVDFDPGVGVANISSSGSRDIFIAKYNSQGNYQWAGYLHGTDGSLGSDIALDASGNAFLSGSFFATIDADPSANTYNLSTNGSTDIFLAKYNPTGALLWAFNIGGPDWDFAFNLAVDSAGGVAITGNFRDSMDVDPGTDSLMLYSNTVNFSDIYVAHYNSLGSFNWGLNAGGTSHDGGYAIVPCGSQDFCVTGYFQNTVDFDPGSGSYSLSALGNSEVFIAKYGANNCNPSFSTDSISSCTSITWIDGNTYTTSNNSATFSLTNSQGCDSIVTLNLEILSSTLTYDSISTCDSFTWIDGITYISSTTSPTFTLTNSQGCDSVVTLHLEILNSNTGIDSISTCDSYTWIDGITYTSSTTSPTFNLTNNQGCDSVVSLHLEILNSNSAIDSISACDSYTWIDGITYTSSTTSPTFILTNSQGCDSVVTLHLEILNSNTGIDSISACDSFTWIDGITYTSSTTSPTYTLTNNQGCDSVVTLHLEILNSNSGIDSISACDSFTWIDGITYTSSTTSPTFTLTNSQGCDSVVSLHLEILNSNTGIDSISACDSFTWIDGITYTNSTTGPTFTFTNSQGCDSLVTLNLNINNIDTAVSRNGFSLSAQASNATFQWLDCNDAFKPIPGANSSTFNPSVDGRYAVEISQSTCVDTSSCHTINGIGLEQLKVSSDLHLYPNPGQGNYVIAGPNMLINPHLQIFNARGQKVLDRSYSSTQELSFQLKEPSGIYLVLVSSKEQVKKLRLVQEFR